MGFDFNILYGFFICPKTGKPYAFKDDDTKLTQDFTLQVSPLPEQYRRFVQLRGPWLHVYTEEFSTQDIFTVPISRLLEIFPSWDYVKASAFCDMLEDEWTEEDHHGFKAALEWFEARGHPAYATWSY